MSANRLEGVPETAHLLADAAGAAALSYFRNGVLAADNKHVDGTFDPVTEADRAAERAMREILARERPQDGIIGEEFGQHLGQSGLTWVLDPIDGTRSFLSGAPVWGVLIAVADENGPLYGMISQPYIGERFEGGLGIARASGPRGQTPLRVLGERSIDEAILFTTFPEVGSPEEGVAFARVASRVKLVRYGLDCYAYALLASGQIDLVIEAGLAAYDVNAPIAVIEAAGGIVTDWRGGPAHRGGRIVAAAGHAQHMAALEILSSVG